jgi:hypothetical protein
MNHVLVTTDPRLTCSSSSCACEDLDEGRILDDLAIAMPDSAPDRWAHPLGNHDHVVLAEERSQGRRIALLGTMEQLVENIPFLSIETAYFAPQQRPRRLLGRMIAMAMLRIAQTGPIPRAIVVRTREPGVYQAIAELGARVPGAVLYPDTNPVILPLTAAGLARRIALQRGSVRLVTKTGTLLGGQFFDACRESGIGETPNTDYEVERLFRRSLQPADQMLVVLDCRTTDEVSLTETMRKIYQLR